MDRGELLQQWQNGIRILHIQHYLAANHNAKMHKALGIPVIILGTIVGTSVFASLESSPEPWVKILVGLLSITSVVLSSLQTFMGFGDKEEKHKAVAVKYGELRRELEHFIATMDKQEDSDKFIEEFMEKWNQVDKESISTAQRFHDMAVASVKKNFSVDNKE